MKQAPKLAVWKFASCDGCQLSLLDCEDDLLAIAGAVEIAHFLEASSKTVRGPYDVSLVEGSITTAHDAERIQQVRRQSKFLVTIGACATAGGIQALKNFADVEEYLSVVYATPDYISTLATSTPISDHVAVDFELRGCPIDKGQLRRGAGRLPERAPPEHPRVLGLHGVQAARDDLRHRRARDAVPRARSRTPAAARSAPRTRAAATAASGRWRARTRPRSADGCASSG